MATVTTNKKTAAKTETYSLGLRDVKAGGDTGGQGINLAGKGGAL